MSHGFFSLEGGHLLSGSTIKEEGGEKDRNSFIRRISMPYFQTFHKLPALIILVDQSSQDPVLILTLPFPSSMRIGQGYGSLGESYCSLGEPSFPATNLSPTGLLLPDSIAPEVTETEFLGRHSGLELGLRETSRKGQLPCKTVNTQSSPSHSGTAVSNC